MDAAYLRRGVQFSFTTWSLSATLTLNRFERSSAPTRALWVERAAASEGRGLRDDVRGEAGRTERLSEAGLKPCREATAAATFAAASAAAALAAEMASIEEGDNDLDSESQTTTSPLSVLLSLPRILMPSLSTTLLLNFAPAFGVTAFDADAD